MICSRKEFQDLCGLSRGNYNTYRDRDKRIIEHDVDGEPFIDTDNVVNKTFYENRKIILEKKRQESSGEIPLAESPNKKVPAAKTKTEPPTKHKVNSGTDEKVGNAYLEKYTLEAEKTRAEIAYKKATTALAEQRLATLSKNNVPMPIVMQMFSELSRTLLIGHKDYSEQLISKFCHKHKINDAIKIDLIAEMVSGLNATHARSVNIARSHMKNELKNSNIKESLFGGTDNEEG